MEYLGAGVDSRSDLEAVVVGSLEDHFVDQVALARAVLAHDAHDAQLPSRQRAQEAGGLLRHHELALAVYYEWYGLSFLIFFHCLLANLKLITVKFIY
jgi:hypothetical protein